VLGNAGGTIADQHVRLLCTGRDDDRAPTSDFRFIENDDGELWNRPNELLDGIRQSRLQLVRVACEQGRADYASALCAHDDVTDVVQPTPVVRIGDAGNVLSELGVDALVFEVDSGLEIELGPLGTLLDEPAQELLEIIATLAAEVVVHGHLASFSSGRPSAREPMNCIETLPGNVHLNDAALDARRQRADEGRERIAPPTHARPRLALATALSEGARGSRPRCCRRTAVAQHLRRGRRCRHAGRASRRSDLRQRARCRRPRRAPR